MGQEWSWDWFWTGRLSCRKFHLFARVPLQNTYLPFSKPFSTAKHDFSYHSTASDLLYRKMFIWEPTQSWRKMELVLRPSALSGEPSVPTAQLLAWGTVKIIDLRILNKTVCLIFVCFLFLIYILVAQILNLKLFILPPHPFKDWDYRLVPPRSTLGNSMSYSLLW